MNLISTHQDDTKQNSADQNTANQNYISQFFTLRIIHRLLQHLSQQKQVLQQRKVVLWLTIQHIALLFLETEAMVAEIDRLATLEAIAEPAIDFNHLPNIRSPGKCGVNCQIWQLQNDQREFPPGVCRQRKFRVLVYTPQEWRSGKTPVVVISHGLGSRPEAFAEYAEHLASYGYLVAIPQHPGSDAEQMWKRFTGSSQEMFTLEEFGDRPLDISDVLDELERRNPIEYQGRLNLDSVGVMGHSFGGYTGLMLAGAEINFASLENACDMVPGVLNLSLILQCRALHLPRDSYRFRDPRVKAVIPIDPVGSEVFGANGLSPIQIPVMIIAGSHDSTTPAIFEQIRIFPWLKTPQRYLALVEGKSHVGNFSRFDAGLKLMLRTVTSFRGPNSTLFYNYVNSLSLAFFEVYIAGDADYLPYLQASYGQFISQPPFKLDLISSVSCRTNSCDAIDRRLKNFVAQL